MTQIADLVAPLVVLAENGIPTDVQELLVQGDARRGIAPGSLEKAMSIYAASLIQSQAARIAELESEVAEKRHAIDRDRYIVAAVLGEIRKQINGHRWLLEGRGPYEWDDDRYHLEFGDWLDNVESASENLAKLAWDKSNSETDPERVEAARKAAGSFLIETRPGTRVMLSSDLGLPCPTCKQIPRAALKEPSHDQ